MFTPQKFKLKSIVNNLVDATLETPAASTSRAIDFAALGAWAVLDQKGRPRRKPHATAKRVIKTRRARRVREITIAACVDRHSESGIPDAVATQLIDIIRADGGLSGLVQRQSARTLFRKFEKIQPDLEYVVGITEYMVRCNVHPDKRNPETIEDAKVFVEKWIEDCGISKIGKVWEDFKLAAPYVYALSLEPSFQPQKAKRPDQPISWAIAFASKPHRVARFLGHAAFAMDVLNQHARDQRESDFERVLRVVPAVGPFNAEERMVIESIARDAALK